MLGISVLSNWYSTKVKRQYRNFYVIFLSFFLFSTSSCLRRTFLLRFVLLLLLVLIHSLLFERKKEGKKKLSQRILISILHIVLRVNLYHTVCDWIKIKTKTSENTKQLTLHPCKTAKKTNRIVYIFYQWQEIQKTRQKKMPVNERAWHTNVLHWINIIRFDLIMNENIQYSILLTKWKKKKETIMKIKTKQNGYEKR